jgi:hypothetical protein
MKTKTKWASWPGRKCPNCNETLQRKLAKNDRWCFRCLGCSYYAFSTFKTVVCRHWVDDFDTGWKRCKKKFWIHRGCRICRSREFLERKDWYETLEKEEAAATPKGKP